MNGQDPTNTEVNNTVTTAPNTEANQPAVPENQPLPQEGAPAYQQPPAGADNPDDDDLPEFNSDDEAHAQFHGPTQHPELHGHALELPDDWSDAKFIKKTFTPLDWPRISSKITQKEGLDASKLTDVYAVFSPEQFIMADLKTNKIIQAVNLDYSNILPEQPEDIDNVKECIRKAVMSSLDRTKTKILIQSKDIKAPGRKISVLIYNILTSQIRFYTVKLPDNEVFLQCDAIDCTGFDHHIHYSLHKANEGVFLVCEAELGETLIASRRVILATDLSKYRGTSVVIDYKRGSLMFIKPPSPSPELTAKNFAFVFELYKTHCSVDRVSKRVALKLLKVKISDLGLKTDPAFVHLKGTVFIPNQRVGGFMSINCLTKETGVVPFGLVTHCLNTPREGWKAEDGVSVLDANKEHFYCFRGEESPLAWANSAGEILMVDPATFYHEVELPQTIKIIKGEKLFRLKFPSTE